MKFKLRKDLVGGLLALTFSLGGPSVHADSPKPWGQTLPPLPWRFNDPLYPKVPQPGFPGNESGIIVPFNPNNPTPIPPAGAPGNMYGIFGG
jgi:hypothetical protein